MNALRLTIVTGVGLVLIASAGVVTGDSLSHRVKIVGQSTGSSQIAHRGHHRRDDDRGRHHRYRDRRHDRDGFDRHRFHRRAYGHYHRFHYDPRFAGGWWPHYRAHGFRHRYFHGSHYYYNRFGFYFPDYGFIPYGHRHGGHCPTWHFQSFAAGAVLGAVINR